jgi:hypothetical protein
MRFAITVRSRSLLALLLLAAPLPAAAQFGFASDRGVILGVRSRRYEYGLGYPIHDVRQLAVPIGLVFPLGSRLSIDIGTAYATTTTVDSSWNSYTLEGFTDTQLRGSYVFGRDAVVASVMFNLPTGQTSLDLDQFVVSSSISSNFLLFPVNSYGNGFSVTSGVAGAIPAGAWNFGLAVSGRYNAVFTPFSDTAQAAVRYQPGLEGRVRVGVDRLLGRSRVAAGFTLSTFTNDEFTGLATSPGTAPYAPGTRYIGELNLASPIGRSSLSIYLWDYYRNSTSDTTVAAANMENVFTGGTAFGIPLSPHVVFQPVAEARLYSASGSGSGTLIGFAATIRFIMGDHWTLTPGGRYDFGNIASPGIGGAQSVNGWEGSLLLRYGW